MPECPFCNSSRYLKTHGLAVCLLDGYPVSEGHRLIVPIRHVEKFSDIANDEMQDILEMAQTEVTYLIKDLGVDGVNVGWNLGYAAGQTVPHIHLHLIPRILGDVSDPIGGIRGVLPEKRIY